MKRPLLLLALILFASSESRLGYSGGFSDESC